MAANPTLHHVNLKTTRLQEMIDWYALVVGMEVTYQFAGGCWLSNDEANHRLAMLASDAFSDDPGKFSHNGMHYLAFEYETIDDLLGVYQRLEEYDITPHAALDHGMTTSFYYADPDGNSVELQYDNFRDWHQSKRWMQTSPDFAADPIGKTVDPAQMIKARQEGASADEVHRRGYNGEWPLASSDLRVPL